jgi:hypothetical protein
MAGLGVGRERHRAHARFGAGRFALALLTAAACGGGRAHETDRLTGDAGASGGNGGTGSGGAGGAGAACADLFAPTLQTFAIDISAGDWTAIQNEFETVGQLPDDVFVEHQATDYPVVFHYGTETFSDAFIHLRGDSSWREAAQTDGPAGKMQLAIVFDHLNPDATFHGVSKIRLDMPRTDPTFLRDRVANAWLRSAGIPAVCATSSRLMVNGSFYGLFVVEETVGHQMIKKWFPGNSGGDLWDGGETAKTNTLNPNHARQQMFWDATTPAALTAIVDVPGSLRAWAAEALLNDGDGYWGGEHNFFIYDQGAKGFVFFPHDLDSSLDYLGRFDSDPITWWSARPDWPLPIPQHYLIVIHDDALRAQFVEALRAQLALYDVAKLQSWIDDWSGQISDAVTADPHRPIDVAPEDFETAVALMRQGIADRADYLKRWLACWDGGAGDDADGDGFIWCHDCRDDMASVHTGAAEICGNLIDDDCNGGIDDGCL